MKYGLSYNKWMLYEKDIIAGITQLNGKNILIFSLCLFICLIIVICNTHA